MGTRSQRSQMAAESRAVDGRSCLQHAAQPAATTMGGWTVPLRLGKSDTAAAATRLGLQSRRAIPPSVCSRSAAARSGDVRTGGSRASRSGRDAGHTAPPRRGRAAPGWPISRWPVPRRTAAGWTTGVERLQRIQRRPVTEPDVAEDVKSILGVQIFPR